MVVLETDDGRVEGTQEGGHWVFRGIPYAAPPVGPLRFHPPQAPVPWTEVRSCRTFGAKAPQPAARLLPAAPLPCAEDCLTLNVWTPGVDAGHRPVFAWVHDGGFTSGSGADPFSTGETFAEQGIVFVSMNYRLGALGFLHLADILGHPYETSGNCGLLDVLAALRWVKRHIERFGGDPNYVTLGGVSAGAKLVATHEAGFGLSIRDSPDPTRCHSGGPTGPTPGRSSSSTKSREWSASPRPPSNPASMWIRSWSCREAQKFGAVPSVYSSSRWTNGSGYPIIGPIALRTSPFCLQPVPSGEEDTTPFQEEVTPMATIHIRNTGQRIEGESAVRQFLADNNVYYDHWDPNKLPAHLRDKFVLAAEDQEAILQAYREDIEHLAQSRGYVKWDVIALSEATPNLEELLKKFEQVHTHTEDEVRAIVAGSGIFIIKGKPETGYFDVELEAGDVISVPENNPHFFTLTDERKVVAIRLFIDPSGWVAHPYEDPEFVKA